MKVLLHSAARAHIEGLAQRPGGTILLHGPASVGKATVALELARRLNCLGCEDGSCRSCRMAMAGNHPDIMVVRPDEKGKIGIEAVHQLQHSLRYQQYEAASHRVAIMEQVDRLTLPAQQALLKTLEEPPAGTTILLTAPAPTGLLPTVVSRCQLVYLPPVTEAEVADFIRQSYPEVDAQLVAKLSRGLPGRAITYLTDTARVTEDEIIAEETESLLNTGGLFERLQIAARMAAVADDRERYLAELVEQVRARKQQLPTAGRLEAVERLLQRLQANVSPKTAFEALAVELG